MNDCSLYAVPDKLDLSSSNFETEMIDCSLYAVPDKLNVSANSYIYDAPQPSPTGSGVNKAKKADTEQAKPKSKCFIALTITVAALVMVVTAACIGFALKIFLIPSNQYSPPPTACPDLDLVNLSYAAHSQQLEEKIIENITETLVPIYSELKEKIERLENITTFQVQDMVSSCAALPPSSPSGYYWVSAFAGAAQVYCDTSRACGRATGGWVRVAHLDMTNSSQRCPTGLTESTLGNKRTCVKETEASGCSSLRFNTPISYSSVCGRVIAYQYGSTSAFLSVDDGVDEAYVDGVSLTHGRPRRHIWTFAAALDEVGTGGQFNNCPCIKSNFVGHIPSFVESDYFCDTGSAGTYRRNTFYSSDPLWDGAGCGPLSTCCSFNTPPWFYKQLSRSTTDYIEMRVCRDASANDENIAVEMVDLFVKI